MLHAIRRLKPAAAALAASSALVAWPGLLPAHEDIDLQIAAVTKQISAAPDDASLYARRADLHRVHQDYPLAIADFNKSLELAPARVPALVGLAAVYLKTGKSGDALLLGDRALALEPENPACHLARARALAQLNRMEESDRAYTKTTSLYQNPATELYIEHAAALSSHVPPNYQRAIAVLEAAIKKRGPIVTLIDPAIKLHTASGDPAAALSSCDQLLATLANNPKWLCRRGDLLAMLNRQAEARRAYLDSQKILANLPVRRRNTRAMLDLQKKINEALESLGTDK